MIPSAPQTVAGAVPLIFSRDDGRRLRPPAQRNGTGGRPDRARVSYQVKRVVVTVPAEAHTWRPG
jgi:hypothetical protein